ncbi:hypothetical protein [Eggerthella lenta]|uniref:hypothetical protein n=1 Tax=Eggerthella lenta TaxID=84112 RepID=UPI0022E19365|nr:hypothetical protein [Eggerthella lenta]
MALAGWRRLYPAELRADFQQYYGLNIDRMGREYSALHAADLAVMLPSNSRTYLAIDPENAWTLEAQLSAAVVNAARDLVWLEADAKRRMSNRPKPIGPRPAPSSPDAEAIDADGYLEALERLREEAARGDRAR